METDSFFCQLLKQLPQTLFELLHLPGEMARHYRFDSVEIKKSFRIDGLFLPDATTLPVYFVEVQFRRSANFHANLFAEVFTYLNDCKTRTDWAAVAIFENRRMEPKYLAPYENLLRSKRLTRIYLDEFEMPADPPLGLGILQLVSAPESAVKNLVGRLIQKVERDFTDSDSAKKVIELVEELLLRRFTELGREEIRKMFQLHDLRKSKVWQEAHEEEHQEGRQEGETRTKTELVRKWLARGRSVQQIAELLEIPLKDARRLVRDAAKLRS
ncbi:MAG: Rpn family recombination-promoting nuclease/putative transposase [Planctomycetes bacterium]|nr:Rpn family recombination-promoting nuclease/putative transposase [Planctomycetota bacterium]